VPNLESFEAYYFELPTSCLFRQRIFFKTISILDAKNRHSILVTKSIRVKHFSFFLNPF
jgi:hypothetical protein